MKKIKFTEEEWAKLNNGSKGSDEVELPKHSSVISENGNELLFDKEGNLIKELPQQEISDEEILDAAARCKLYSDLDISVGSFELGARWYREQLKQL